MRHEFQPNLARSVRPGGVACPTQHRTEGRREARGLRLHPTSDHSGRDEVRRVASGRFALEPETGGRCRPAQEPRLRQAAIAAPSATAGAAASTRPSESTPTDPSTILETAHAG